jgi:hypothetical protein
MASGWRGFDCLASLPCVVVALVARFVQKQEIGKKKRFIDFDIETDVMNCASTAHRQTEWQLVYRRI